jgi:two-component system sensor histidine kinase KdpD
VGEERAREAGRVLVCVRPHPGSVRLVRAAHRMATSWGAPWVAAYVESPAQRPLTPRERTDLDAALRLAEELGGETVVLGGTRVATVLLDYARSHGVTRVVVGKPAHPRWRDRLRGSLLDAIVRESRDVDVYAISGEGEGGHEAQLPPSLVSPATATWARAALAVLGGSLVAAVVLHGRHTQANLVTLYLLALGAMTAVAFLVSRLSARVREHADAALAREERTRALYATSRELAALTVPEEIAAAGARRLGELARGEAVVRLADDAAAGELRAEEWDLFLPLAGARSTLGVAAVRGAQVEVSLLETVARIVGGALERTRLTRAAEAARLDAERERLRGTLLSSVSHDLRTPLAAITGAASTLLEERVTEAARRDLERTILEESQRLNRLIANLLEMTRLESGEIDLRREWHSLEEILGSALSRLERVLAAHRVETTLEGGLPLVHVDAVLVEQLLLNLLENAGKYTPAGSTIRVEARRVEGAVAVEVQDDGPGLPPGREERVFDKFHRERTAGRTGFGLGLAICRAIATAHGGQVVARNLAPRGVAFVVTLPLPEGAPSPPPEDEDDA